MNEQPFASLQALPGFPSALTCMLERYGDGCTPRCVAELQIMDLEASVKEKEEWWRKIRDPQIASKWYQELVNHLEAQEKKITDNDENAEIEQTGKRDDEGAYRAKLVKYALAECQHLAEQYQNGPVRPAAVDGVFARDDLKDTDLQQKLLQEIAVLRNQPAIGHSKEDRHPGTPQMVDLVHPSLFAYEQGKTMVLPNVGAESTKMPEWESFLGKEGIIETIKEGTKPVLQWLPAEFHVSEDGQQCTIRSYINSLHPIEHEGLYKSIGTLFCHVLPLFEEVLAEAGDYYAEENKVLRERALRIPIPDEWWDGELPDYDDEDYDPDVDPNINRTFLKPNIPEFEGPPQFNRKRANVSLRNRPLQVIVKIASLELDAEQSYDGGVWHVEGTLHERIVATACCYLQCSNVTGGQLAFRTSIREFDYEQNDGAGVERMYNFRDGDPLVQEAGSCVTKEGRVLAWPNTKQHRLFPVHLIDNTLPGKRTICCFFLVDPTLRVRSTATVPPQQLAWLTESVHQPILAGAGMNEKALCDKTSSFLASPSLLTYEAACERRQRLMDERAIPAQGQDDFMVRTFSLCEH